VCIGVDDDATANRSEWSRKSDYEAITATKCYGIVRRDPSQRRRIRTTVGIRERDPGANFTGPSVNPQLRSRRQSIGEIRCERDARLEHGRRLPPLVCNDHTSPRDLANVETGQRNRGAAACSRAALRAPSRWREARQLLRSVEHCRAQLASALAVLLVLHGMPR